MPFPIATQVTQTAKTVSQSQAKTKTKTLKRSRRIKKKAKQIAGTKLSVAEKILSIVNLEGEVLKDDLVELLINYHNKAHINRIIRQLINKNRIAAIETDEGILLTAIEEEE